MTSGRNEFNEKLAPTDVVAGQKKLTENPVRDFLMS